MSARTLLILSTGLTIGLVAGFLIGLFTPAGSHVLGIPLWLEAFQRICTSIGGLGTAAALLYGVRQFSLIRQQSDLVQKNILASLDGQLYSRLDSFNRLIVEHDAEYEMLATVRVGEEQPGHRARLHRLCDLAFTFYEQIFKQHFRYDLLDTEDWEEWRQGMAHFFEKIYVCGYWQKSRLRYAPKFRDFADGLAGAASAALSP